ncbi:MAG TPA: CopG family transcriptional regulator [Paraburkholderia sp.]|nr:CopG family transcriptional regulator [Paraburkholderia sp.]
MRIIVSIDPDLLAALDSVATRKGLSRAGTMSLACADLIDREQQRQHHD